MRTTSSLRLRSPHVINSSECRSGCGAPRAFMLLLLFIVKLNSLCRCKIKDLMPGHYHIYAVCHQKTTFKTAENVSVEENFCSECLCFPLHPSHTLWISPPISSVLQYSPFVNT